MRRRNTSPRTWWLIAALFMVAGLLWLAVALLPNDRDPVVVLRFGASPSGRYQDYLEEARSIRRVAELEPTTYGFKVRSFLCTTWESDELVKVVLRAYRTSNASSWQPRRCT
jgi:hypothetical protein